MTEKQRLFAECFAECGNGTKSAEEAGYTKNHSRYAQKLLDNPEVRKYIKEVIEKKHQESVLSSGQCREVLSSIVSNESNTPSERMKAIDLLMEIGGSCSEDRNINISVSYGDIHEVQN